MSLEKFPEIEKLSAEEKIILVENLWDSIRAEINSKPVPEIHKQELEKRQSTLDKDNLLSLKDLKDRLKDG